MKKTVIFSMLVTATLTLADQGMGYSPQQQAGYAQEQGQMRNNPQGMRGERFEEVKEKMLSRISQREQCVRASRNFEELKGCMPERRGGGGGMQR